MEIHPAPALYPMRPIGARLVRETDWLSPDLVNEPCLERAASIERAGEFGATFTHDDETRSYAALAPVALAANEQLELDLPGYDLRAAIRNALAEKIEREVLPIAGETWLERYPERL